MAYISIFKTFKMRDDKKINKIDKKKKIICKPEK